MDFRKLHRRAHIQDQCALRHHRPDHLPGKPGTAGEEGSQGEHHNDDGAAGQVTNVADANQYLSRKYREGWTLNG